MTTEDIRSVSKIHGNDLVTTSIREKGKDRLFDYYLL